MAKKQSEEREESIDNCGIIMPISTIDECDEKHWANVKSIISEAISEAGFNPRIVSASDDCSVIQKNIVQNIYDDKIVVCDVSGKNPNVMFELGMRLAFDKPAIIVIDDKTPYSFDTSVIEHITYPRNLDYYAIIDFEKNLSKKISATIESSKDPNYSTFLKQFARIKPAKIENKDGTAEDLILSKIDELDNKINRVQMNLNFQTRADPFIDKFDNSLNDYMLMYDDKYKSYSKFILNKLNAENKKKQDDNTQTR